MLANRCLGVLYLGVTSDLPGRIWQHKNRTIPGFTCRYNLDRLVWYEAHVDISEAIKREKRLKKWNRGWKIKLIEARNPAWMDLFDEICGVGGISGDPRLRGDD